MHNEFVRIIWSLTCIYLGLKSYLLTRVARIENVRWKSMSRVVNEFARCIAKVEGERFSYG
jgi:hypothetical protein